MKMSISMRIYKMEKRGPKDGRSFAKRRAEAEEREEWQEADAEREQGGE